MVSPRPVAQNAGTSGCAQARDFLLNFAIPAGAIQSELMSNSGFGHSSLFQSRTAKESAGEVYATEVRVTQIRPDR
jgi:hypothetical protein